MNVYYWLFNRAHKGGVYILLWRKWASALTVTKHLQRGNWRQAIAWVRMTL